MEENQRDKSAHVAPCPTVVRRLQSTILCKRSRTQLLIIHLFHKFLQLLAKMNCSIPSSKVNAGFYRPTARFDNLSGNILRQYALPTHFNFRLKNSVTLALRQKLLPAYSSKINPPSEVSDGAIGHRLPASASKINPSEGSDGANGEGTQGPPFLTILAGFLVFLAVCWVIGSFVLWLIGLFVRA